MLPDCLYGMPGYVSHAAGQEQATSRQWSRSSTCMNCAVLGGIRVLGGTWLRSASTAERPAHVMGSTSGQPSGSAVSVANCKPAADEKL